MFNNFNIKAEGGVWVSLIQKLFVFSKIFEDCIDECLKFRSQFIRHELDLLKLTKDTNLVILTLKSSWLRRYLACNLKVFGALFQIKLPWLVQAIVTYWLVNYSIFFFCHSAILAVYIGNQFWSILVCLRSLLNFTELIQSFGRFSAKIAQFLLISCIFGTWLGRILIIFSYLFI